MRAYGFLILVETGFETRLVLAEIFGFSKRGSYEKENVVTACLVRLYALFVRRPKHRYRGVF